MKIIPKFQPGGAINYKVVYGDTVSDIAKAYGVTIKEIKDANNLNDKYFIRAGLNLIIPVENSKNDNIKSALLKNRLDYKITKNSGVFDFKSSDKNYLDEIEITPKRHNWNTINLSSKPITGLSNITNLSNTTNLSKQSAPDYRGKNDDMYITYKDPVSKKTVQVANKSVLYDSKGNIYILDLDVPLFLSNMKGGYFYKLRMYDKNRKSQGWRYLTDDQIKTLTTVSPSTQKYDGTIGDFTYALKGNGYYVNDLREYFNPYYLTSTKDKELVIKELNTIYLNNLIEAYYELKKAAEKQLKKQ